MVTAQAQLAYMLAGEAPDDASIGLYSEALETPQQLAANAQADALEQQQVLLQDGESASAAAAALTGARADQPMQTGAAAQALGAVEEIDQRLAAGLLEAKLNVFSTDLDELLQAVEAGSAVASAEAADLMQANLAIQSESPLEIPMAPALNLTAAAASNLAAQIQNLATTAQTGDLADATALARTIRDQLQTLNSIGFALFAPRPLATVAPSLLAPSLLAPSLVDLTTNPLLLVFQASLLLGVKTTLNKVRKPLADPIAIWPIPALDPYQPGKDGRKDD